MKKNTNIIDDIIEYLKVESHMGTDWFPVRKRAGPEHEAEEKKTRASPSKKPAAASSGNGSLAERPLLPCSARGPSAGRVAESEELRYNGFAYLSDTA